MVESEKKKTNRRSRFFLIVGLLLLLAGGGWFYFKNAVEKNIESQLLALNLGQPEIQSVSISSGGVRANGIRFFRTADDAEPWLTVERLSIIHPLRGLAAGDTEYGQIEIDSARALIDLNNTASEEADRAEPFDFSQISLPAKTVTLTDSSIVLRNTGREDLVLDGVNATLVQNDDATNPQIEIDGSISSLAGSAWTMTGDLNPADNAFAIRLSSDSVAANDGQWQDWPGVPDSFEQYVRGDAQAKVDVTVESSADTGFVYGADIELKKSALRFPVFDLPVTINGGTVRLEHGQLFYRDILATVDGRDRLTASGSTSITQFPSATEFSAEFVDLDIASIRKLVPDIPTIVSTRADGSVTGQIEIERSLRTTLNLSVTAATSSLSYGQINSNAADLQVELQPLILDSAQQLETIDGFVLVNADVNDEPVNEIFATFELNELAGQMEIEAAASGKVLLNLPLATVDQVETWRLEIDAAAPTGSITGQPVRNLQTRAELRRGNLVFPNLTAIPLAETIADKGKAAGENGAGENQSGAELGMSIDWPLIENATHPETGVLDIRGSNVPASWVVGFTRKQLENAEDDNEKIAQRARDATDQWNDALDRLSGAVNFRSGLTIAARSPDQISGWSADGAVVDSAVSVGEYQLEGLNADVRLEQGNLVVDRLSGSYTSGGDLTGDIRVDLNSGEDISARIFTSNMPLKWIASVASRISPDVSRAFESAGIDVGDTQRDLDGVLTAQFELQTGNAGGEPTWALDAQLESSELRIKGEQLTDVRVDGVFDSERLRVNRALAKFADSGLFDLQGDWVFESGSGQAELNWEGLRPGWLAGFVWPAGESITGTSSGKVRISTAPDVNVPVAGAPAMNAAAVRSLAIAVEGQIATRGIGYGAVEFRDLGFDIRTQDGVVYIEKVAADNKSVDLKVMASIGLQEPFPFRVNGQFAALPVTQMIASESLTEFAGLNVDLSGVADAQADLQGSLSPFDWSSTGELKIQQPRIGDNALSEISATWNHIGNDWATSRAEINVAGGRITMVELTSLPQRVKVEITDVNSRELTALVDLPVEFDGKISGDASLNDWSLFETRWADLNLRGGSVILGPADLGELQGKLEYRSELLTYSLEGRMVDGKLVANGETKLAAEDWWSTELPLSIRLTGGSLNGLYSEVNSLRALRPLRGTMNASLNMLFKLDAAPGGNGSVQVGNLSWNNELLTREVSTDLSLNEGVLELKNLSADLQRGQISGRATLPLNSNATGSYQLDIRRFDLKRLLEIVMEDPIDADGMFDARISGQTGRTISGQGTIGLGRTEILGLSGRSLKVPIQFSIDPRQQSARFEIRRSRFQLFDGNVNGSASIEIGSRFNVKTDLKVSNLDTGSLFASLAGVRNTGKGKLSGQFVLEGRSIRSARDLKGSFKGELKRAEAFKLPLLSDLAKFLGGVSIQSRDFDSEEIDLQLSKGRIEVRKLNLTSSLALIAITGSIYLDGKLDLEVVARIEQLNQPSLLEELAGSPLSRIRGTPISFFAQAADFLSNRLVFLKAGGTFNRPQIRLDSSQQLREEVIRYFLRGSQFLPIPERRNK